MKKIKLISRMNDHYALIANVLLLKCRVVFVGFLLTSCYDFEVVPTMEEQQYKKPVASDSSNVVSDTVRISRCGL